MGYICEADWNKRKNDLTWKLLKEGYTPQNHPDYVRWIDYSYEFEYTSEWLRNSTWEAPCGVQRKGEFTHGHMSYAGIDWRVENNNYNFHCPYRKKECELWHPLLQGYKFGAKCSWHISDKPYNYENSTEKIEDERRQLIGLNLTEKFGYPGMIHCACCHINEDTCKPYFKYDPLDCIQYMFHGCDNPNCYITEKERDLTQANIFYDVKTTSEYRKGFIVQPVVKIKKGVKLFESSKATTDLKMYLKMHPDAPFNNEKGKQEHSRSLFFAEHHEIKYELEILNVRIERRESRDLLQDLQDVKEGIEVTHQSDLKKKEKEAKHERRIVAKEKRIKKLWKRFKAGDEFAELMLMRKGLLEEELKNQLLADKTEKPNCEQLSLF